MNSETVDLIATDPPFNKGRDFRATPDSLASGAKFQDRWSWEEDVHPEWVDQITDDFPNIMKGISLSRLSYGDDMGAFLCFMAVRLLEMQRVLKSTGSIYLHCDPTASHYLKALMDAVFGKDSFRNEIVWHYTNASRGKKQLAKSHDVIFWFSKGKKYTFNRDLILAPFNSKMTEWRYRRGGQSGKPVPNGKTPDDVISLPSLNVMAKERTGYPTQKPLALYERIIKASSNKGDVVLDPFAGCATTLIAAERLNRQWVGIDIWDNAIDAVRERLSKDKFLADESADGRLALYSVHYETIPPQRTDDGQSAAPFLKVKEHIKEPEGKKMSREEMYNYLLEQNGKKCQGCNRTFDDPRYLELEHNTPRSDGGINHISNRILLCDPCNKLKSNTFTLSGLRRENEKRGYMVDS